MQVFVTCPDWGLPAVTVTAGADSVVNDVLTAAAGEWDVDPDEVELSFAGDTLCETDRLADHGVVANSEFEMWKKQFRVFGKNWFVDDAKREKLLLWMRDHITEYLRLDTPTFTADGCLTVDGDLLPSDAKQVAFRNSDSNSIDISRVTTIADKFLFRCSRITSLDLSGLSSVTTIGNYFLSHCLRITSLNLSGLCSATTIGDSFLFRCSQVTSLDLSGLSSVTTIGDYFLSFCSQITSLDLLSLSSVTTIGEGFLFSCEKITSLDLSGLGSVTTIGDYFLFSCEKITSLDFSGLSSVTTIGDCFLSKCYALESVQLPESNSVLFEESVKAAIDHSG